MCEGAGETSKMAKQILNIPLYLVMTVAERSRGERARGSDRSLGYGCLVSQGKGVFLGGQCSILLCVISSYSLTYW